MCNINGFRIIILPPRQIDGEALVIVRAFGYLADLIALLRADIEAIAMPVGKPKHLARIALWLVVGAIFDRGHHQVSEVFFEGIDDDLLIEVGHDILHLEVMRGKLKVKELKPRFIHKYCALSGVIHSLKQHQPADMPAVKIYLRRVGSRVHRRGKHRRASGGRTRQLHLPDRMATL